MNAPSLSSCLSAALDPQDFEFVQDFVRKYAALALESNKEYLVETRNAPRAK